MKLSTLQKGLVFHAPLSEERYNPATKRVDDLTPYENHGTADAANAGVFVADRMGQSDRAMQFNGTTDYIDCGNDASLKFGTGDFTFSLWFKSPATGATDYPALIAKGTHNTAGGYIFYLVSNKALLRLDDKVALASTTIWADNEWHHVVATRNGNGYTLYLDGNEDGSSTIAGVDIDLDLDVYIGARNAPNPEQFLSGSLADVRIYNRAIIPAEITALYEMYRPKLSLGSLMAGCVLDMPLQSRYMKSATVLTDLTPNQNDGTNSGATIGAHHTTFNGTSDNIRIADSESLSPINAMTAMCWVKGAEQSVHLLAHYDPGADERSFSIRSGGTDKATFYISDNGVNVQKSYTSSIVALDNTWHLVGFTFDAGALKLYIDGAEDTNPTKTFDGAITTIHNSTADVMVGCRLNSDTPTGFFAGDLAYARIYNRALTAAEWLLRFEKEKGEFL